MLDLLKPMLLLEILTKALLSKSSTHNVTIYASTEGECMPSTHGIANELLRQPGIQAKVDPAGMLPRRWAWGVSSAACCSMTAPLAVGSARKFLSCNKWFGISRFPQHCGFDTASSKVHKPGTSKTV
jgi:hypothetical protein